MTPRIRIATVTDIPKLERLIDASVRELQKDDYSPEQIEGALHHVFGVDRQLIADGGYFVAELDGEAVGCGGWSRRRTLFGADAIAGRDDSLLEPGKDAAKIRAFFVSPHHARLGIASRLLSACEEAARSHGFDKFELGATLTGEPMYARRGFTAVRREETPLPNGLTLTIVVMHKTAPKGVG